MHCYYWGCKLGQPLYKNNLIWYYKVKHMHSLWQTIPFWCINSREAFNAYEPKDMYKNISNCIFTMTEKAIQMTIDKNWMSIFCKNFTDYTTVKINGLHWIQQHKYIFET